MRKHLFLIIYTILLVGASVFSILSTFVIAKEKDDVPKLGVEETDGIDKEKGKFYTDSNGYQCYKDSNIEITIVRKREYETEIYLADIKINNFKLLKTALAEDKFGLNIKEKPSKITSNGSFPLSRGAMNEDVRILNVYINELSKIYSGVNYVGTSNYYSDDTATAILSLTKLFMLDETDVTDRALMERIIYDAKNSTLMF